MKLFMTGICGRLGRAVAKAADSQDISIVGVDVAPWPDQIMAKPACVDLHQGSYTDLDLIEKLLQGCNGLIHAGGVHGAMVGKIPASDFLDAHLTQLLPVLETARRLGVTNAVLCSTMEVLVGRTYNASAAAYFTEESVSAADTSYSLCRRLMEVLGQEFARQSGMSIASLRFMSFGYGSKEEEGQHLLARSLGAADAASAVLAAVRKPHLQGEVFNIGPASPLQAEDIAKALTDPQAVLEHYYPGATQYILDAGQKLHSKYFWPVTSIRKAGVMLGWEPQLTLGKWLAAQGWQGQHGTDANPENPAWKSNSF